MKIGDRVELLDSPFVSMRYWWVSGRYWNPGDSDTVVEVELSDRPDLKGLHYRHWRYTAATNLKVVAE